MGQEKWQGRSVDCIWLDEEPSRELYSQAVTRTLDRRGMVYMTFTPESGMTETVASFMNNLKSGQSLTNSTWDDASERILSMKGQRGHLSESVMEQILSSYSPHEREMRRYGRPSIGSGLVFPLGEEKVMVEPFPIEDHWPRIAAIDFGWDHPTAAVWLAWDRDTDTVYVYDCYRQSSATPVIHAAAIKERGAWVPVVWPHDGSQHDKGSGQSLADIYRKQGIKMLGTHFKNPGGDIAIEPGIMEILQRMEKTYFTTFFSSL